MSKDSTLFLVTNRHVVTVKNNQTNQCLEEKNAAIPNKLKIWFPHKTIEELRWSNRVIDLFDEKGKKHYFNSLK